MDVKGGGGATFALLSAVFGPISTLNWLPTPGGRCREPSAEGSLRANELTNSAENVVQIDCFVSADSARLQRNFRIKKSDQV